MRGQGYDAILPDPASLETADPDDAADRAHEAEVQRLHRRFLVAAALTLPVVVPAMLGHLVPAIGRALDHPIWPWVALVLTTPVLFWSGRAFYSGAWTAARHGAANMNTLVAIGTLAAYLYSLAATVAPAWFATAGSHHHASPPVYYEVAATIVTLILFGNLLQARATSRTRGAIRTRRLAAQNSACRTGRPRARCADR